ncbi:MAG: ABC transporter ATP-binding protein [Sphingobacteriaceae bacterium]|nr:ABC transporter ATP-binding protein [Sphingobacteriaceae bacterium]
MSNEVFLRRLLRVQNLSVSFLQAGTFHQVTHGVDFELMPGKVLGIVGESGSGKSVTSLAIMGLLPKDFARIETGSIEFQFAGRAVELVGLSKDAHRALRGKGMAMIFQEPMSALNPVMRCGEQVAEAIRLHQPDLTEKEVQDQVIALFKEVQLPRAEVLVQSYPHELSGGQRQRVMIAIALSCNPALLIADEPTTALDVTVQATILALLRSLSESRGLSVIFITHDLGVIAQMADEVLVMYQGKQMEFGKVSQVFQQPKSSYTKGLLACRPVLGQRYERLLTVKDFLEASSEEDLKLPVQAPDIRTAHLQVLYAQQPLLEVHDLKLWYPQKEVFWQKPSYVKAVDGVSFTVFPHETLGLVGESGSGKSTIGKLVAGLQEPTSGSLSYKGVVYDQMNGAIRKLFRRKVQVIFQDPFGSLNPRMTIGEALEEPIKVHGLRKSASERQKRLVELLEQVSLPASVLRKYPHEFSGGQRQRIVIARCLAMEPEFIVCDESVSALDVSVQAQVLNLLKSLQKELGLTYIFISHDLSVVKHLSDRVMVLKAGKCEELQEADALYLHPQTAYTRQLIAAIPETKFY